MTTLHLNLKKKWFDMILLQLTNPELAKWEEYREIKQYWVRRLSLGVFKDLQGNVKKFDPIVFDTITFKNGYHKNAPTMVVEFKGIEIGKAVPEWSDNWQGDVFKIKLGKILTLKK